MACCVQEGLLADPDMHAWPIDCMRLRDSQYAKLLQYGQVSCHRPCHGMHARFGSSLPEPLQGQTALAPCYRLWAANPLRRTRWLWTPRAAWQACCRAGMCCEL